MADLSYDEQIKEHEDQIEELAPAMAIACNEWLDATAKVLAAFWKAKTEEAVLADPAHTKELGKDKLQRLKGQVNQLVANARSEAEEILINGHLNMWPHLDDDIENTSNKPYVSSGQFTAFRVYVGHDRHRKVESGPHELHGMFEEALSRVDDPLDEAGYNAALRVYRGTGNANGEEFAWTDEMVNAMNRYADLHEQQLKAVRDLRAVRAQKEKSEAKGLWEEA